MQKPATPDCERIKPEFSVTVTIIAGSTLIKEIDMVNNFEN
jgi:hypothetical protein